MAVTYQVYAWVTAIYDKWMRERSDRVNKSFIVATIEYILFVTVIHNAFPELNVTL